MRVGESYRLVVRVCIVPTFRTYAREYVIDPPLGCPNLAWGSITFRARKNGLARALTQDHTAKVSHHLNGCDLGSADMLGHRKLASRRGQLSEVIGLIHP